MCGKEEAVAMIRLENCLVSIIVPVYNVEDFLDECIQSLVKQSLKNIEIILVDDGSTDKSLQICKKWQLLDKRIRVIHTENYGVSHARNIGLENVNGDYIGFVDPDDWLEIDAYECMLREMISNDADVVGGGYILEDNDGDKIILKKGAHKAYNREEILLEIFSCESEKILGWSLWDKLFKKKVLSKIRFDEKLISAEDMVFFWQVMLNVKHFTYIPLFKYHYRQRSDSVTHNVTSPQKVISDIEGRRKILCYAKDENEDLKQLLKKNYMTNIVNATRMLLISDSHYYSGGIKHNQSEIRKGMPQILFWRHLSLYQRIWICILCFPHTVCSLLVRSIYFLKAIRKNERNEDRSNNIRRIL